MNQHRYSPKLHKRRVLTHEDFTVYAVNALAVRNVARPDEEFGNFATRHEFPDLIPKGEIWISEKTAPKEGVFFIANALTRLKALAGGAEDEAAYTSGLNVERFLRERLNGVEYRAGQPHKRVPEKVYLEQYATIPDEQFTVAVWVVDGNLVRSLYKTDYTEGGHGYVYRWVPKEQIWIEAALDSRELPFIVAHEYTELRLMRDEGLDYDTAHAICSEVEFQLRKNESPKSLLAPGRRKFGKTDLHALASPEYFAYVRKHYVKD
jgi:hypothetical protein